MGNCLSLRKKQLYEDKQAAFYVPRRKVEAKHDKTVRLITKTGLKYKLHRVVNQDRTRIQEMTESPQQFKEFYCCYNKMMAHFDEHDIDNAYEVALHIQDKASDMIKQVDPNNESKESRQINRIIREYKESEQFYNEIYSEGWIQKSDKNGVKVSTRKQGTTVGVKTQSILDMPFEIFISSLTELDLLKEFMPTIVKSKQFKLMERNIRLGYSVAKMPFLSDRESWFQGGGYSRLDKKKCIFIFSRTITQRPDLQEELDFHPTLDPKAVQLNYKYFVVRYEPISKNKGHVIMALNADMKVSSLPMFLVDMGTEIFGNQIFSSITELAKTYEGSKWQKKVKENPDFYRWIQKEIDQYLQQLEQKKNGKKTETTMDNKMIEM